MLKFKFKKFNILVTFHPITLEKKSSKNHFKNILNALKNIEDTAIIFTKSNADPDNFIINKLIDSFVYKNENAACYDSLGAIKYYSCLKNVDLVLGNSSSGIIEVPSFKIPTINIGDRQKGRLKPESVFDCASNTREIRRMILKFKNKKYNFSQINPYYKKNSSQSILKVLKSVNLDHILKKSFFDLK